jgi:hypothetical protein
MASTEVSLDHLRQYPRFSEVFDEVVRSSGLPPSELEGALLILANLPLKGYRVTSIPPRKVPGLAQRLLEDADKIQRLNTQYAGTLPRDPRFSLEPKLRGLRKTWSRNIFLTLPDLLRWYAKEIKRTRLPKVARRPAEHRRTFEFHLLDLVTGALSLDRLGRKDLENPHYEKVATLISAAYDAAEMKFPKRFESFFGRKQLVVDSDQLKKAYTRYRKRRFKQFFRED